MTAVKLTKPYLLHFQGEVAGFDDAVAKELIEKGFAIPYRGPATEKTEQASAGDSSPATEKTETKKR